MALVELALLKPNPFRDFKIDPLDEESIKRLERSIQIHGFFGGVAVCRWRGPMLLAANRRDTIHPGDLVIAAGHHRIEAAKRQGLTTADLVVSEGWTWKKLADAYARENATQRGLTAGTARAGSVAAGIRLVAMALLTETDEDFTHQFPPLREENALPLTAASIGKLRGNLLTTGEGIGRTFLFDYVLGDIPGFHVTAIQQDLASLKQSGDNARIVREVADQIAEERQRAEQEAAEAETRAKEARRLEAEATAKAEEERREQARLETYAKEQREEKARQQAEAKAKAQAEKQQKAQAAAEARKQEREKAETESKERKEKVKTQRKQEENAEQAALVAAQADVNFDFHGVATHLKAADHIVAFRKVVTSDVVRAYVPMKQQPEVAAKLVALAKEWEKELTGFFIRDNVMAVIAKLKDAERRLSAAEEKQLREANWASRYKETQNLFCGNLRNVINTGGRLLALLAERPENADIQPPPTLAKTLQDAVSVIEEAQQVYGRQKGQELRGEFSSGDTEPNNGRAGSQSLARTGTR